MKIVVTSQGKKGKSFNISVVDGESIVHSESVKGLKQRDELVWKLAELYNAMDIEIVDKQDQEQDSFKYTEVPSIPVLEEDEAIQFFDENSDYVYDRIVQAVDEGIRSNSDYINLFELNGSGVCITSDKPTWKAGLQQALDYFESQEDYKKCIRIRGLIAKL